MDPMMLSNSSENDVLELEDKDSAGDAVSECFSLVQSMLTYIDDTRKSALGMIINRASFLMMVFHLMELKPLLEQLIKEPKFLRTHPTWAPLQHLANTLRDLYSFTQGCATRSRIFLLYCSNGVVDEMNGHFNQLSLCLNAMLASALDLPLELKSSIQVAQAKFISSNISQDPGYNNLAREILLCLDDSNWGESCATSLLRRIADHLKVPEFEAAELKQELQRDLEKAESERLESTGTLQALNQLFSSAQVLADRRRLASADCSLLSAGITSIPSSFFCPITGSLMREPVMIAEEGYTYEKSAILEWFNGGHKTCPDTGKELQSLELVPNLKLQQAMDEFFDHMYQAQMVYVLQVLRNRGMEMPVDQAVQIVKRLTELGPKYRQLVFSLDGVEPLVGLLKPSAPNVREVVVKILINISGAGDAHKVTIIEAGAVPVLLGLLRKNPAEKGGLAQLLCELSKVQAGKKAIVSEKGSMLVIATAFNSSPTNDRPHVTILLDNLCKDDTLMIIEAAKSTIFYPLVSSLTCGDEKTKLEIVTAVLSSFELNEFSSVALVNAGIVPPLLSLLQDGSPQSIQASVKVLSRLSCIEQNKIIIAKAGAIPVLVKFLGYPLDQVKVDVTSILSNLATDSQNAHEIDSEGAVIRLFAMMKSKDTVLQEYSLKTLEFMAKDSQTVCNQVVELGMIPIFYALLRSQKLSVTCQRSVLKILCHITKDHENSRAVAPPAEGVKYLIGLLEGNASIEEKEAVFGILEALLHAEEMKSVMLSDEKLLMLSAEYLQQGNSKIQESAAGLVSKFANLGLMETSIQMALSKHCVLSALIVLIDDQSSTERAKQYAAETLCLFSACTPSLTARQSVVQICLARMGFKKFKACRVHCGKCSMRATFCLIQAGAVPSLVNLIREGGVHSSEWAVKALYTLVDNSENTQKGVEFLMQNNILVPLVDLVGKDQSSTEASVKMLEKIFRVNKYRDSKYSSVAKSVLMTRMAAGSSDVQKLAATALMHLGMIPIDTSYTAITSI